jgi:tetratricopeptide (TPR) repeat protein
VSAPLVSVVVRSMGRPELVAALQSLACQDHPSMDVIVVDATGGRHPPLPSLDWRDGHTVRMVGGERPLRRPDAGNAGLDAVRGEYFAFLDDDDTCDPAHLSSLVAAAEQHPAALVVYGQGKLVNAAGEVESLFGRPFNRALVYCSTLCYWQAALIRTRVRDLGCRFDPAFDICEDRDLLAQIAGHGDFAFVPVATANFCPELGTSGTGRGVNRREAKMTLYDTKLKAKWSGPIAYHWARVSGRCYRGVSALLAGDLPGAQRWFDDALRDYPGDPNAENGLARLALARGDVRAALPLARRALDFSPTAPAYRETFALVQRAAAGVIRRTESCPCASGRRYKDCCGRAEDNDAPPPRSEAVAQAVAAASAALAAGDAARAYEVLAAAEPPTPDAEFKLLLKDCCERLWHDTREQGLWSMARELLERLRARSAEAAETSSPALVVRIGEDDPEPLIERLVEAEERGTSLRVDVVRPDEASYETFRL